MSKHVFPPWHGLVQKILFGLAVILCIALPVSYGKADDHGVSSTAVIAVLVSYFVLWALFSLFVRFGMKSYNVESKLPIHTPTPAPPVLLHSPANRNAAPSASAIKSTSPHSDTSDDQYVNAGKKRVVVGGAEISEDVEDANRDGEFHLRHQSASQKTPRFVDNHSRHQYPPSPPSPSCSPMSAGPHQTSPPTSGELRRKGSNSNVKFASQPTSLEESYPTYASYRRAQHTSFDKFTERIRKALETAKAQQRELLEQQEKQQQEQLEQSRLKIENDTQNDQATGTDSNLLGIPSTVKAGRPRSSSAASMISSLSEKLRLGSGFLVRAGRSRAGSNASATAPPPTSGAGVSTPGSRLSFSGPSVLSVPEPSVSLSSTTTMAAIASAAAVATAMSLPRHPETLSTSDNPKPTHPLAQTLHMQDDSQEGSVVVGLDMSKEPADQEVGSYSEHLPGHTPGDSVSNDDGIHVLSSEPDLEIRVER
ncbi:hypothetical protein BGX21_001056 [Mortierella sp. AD011]|nr:hypothetical protein BGX20_009424 [Mortierella sp. AD010]KAF9401654.1 hypothetical protein BGX21_001056 [Mortierella sp. AD011]